jgi:hypothetical protein
MRKTMNLIEAISKLDARLMRDEQGYEIKGAHWVNRNDVIELLLAAQTPSPAAPAGAVEELRELIAKWRAEYPLSLDMDHPDVSTAEKAMHELEQRYPQLKFKISVGD